MLTFKFQVIIACFPESSESFSYKSLEETLPRVSGRRDVFVDCRVQQSPHDGPAITSRVKLLLPALLTKRQDDMFYIIRQYRQEPDVPQLTKQIKSIGRRKRGYVEQIYPGAVKLDIYHHLRQKLSCNLVLLFQHAFCLQHANLTLMDVLVSGLLEDLLKVQKLHPESNYHLAEFY